MTTYLRIHRRPETDRKTLGPLHMIPFKGRLSLKQYMPLKPVKRGIKVWECADSSNGFVCDLEVYTGKQRNGNPSQEMSDNSPLASPTPNPAGFGVGYAPRVSYPKPCRV